MPEICQGPHAVSGLHSENTANKDLLSLSVTRARCSTLQGQIISFTLCVSTGVSVIALLLCVLCVVRCIMLEEAGLKVCVRLQCHTMDLDKLMKQ